MRRDLVFISTCILYLLPVVVVNAVYTSDDVTIWDLIVDIGIPAIHITSPVAVSDVKSFKKHATMLASLNHSSNDIKMFLFILQRQDVNDDGKKIVSTNFISLKWSKNERRKIIYLMEGNNT